LSKFNSATRDATRLSRGTPNITHLLIASFLLLFFVQGWFFIRANSQTVDEAAHLVAGYSYLVTGEEKHCTRGRAHLLHEMTRGEVIADGWNSDAVEDALSLCLACKGCKADCPVGVDVAGVVVLVAVVVGEVVAVGLAAPLALSAAIPGRKSLKAPRC
jgi:hypothetical protein